MGLSGRLQVLVANPSELHVTLLGSMLRPQSPYGLSVPPARPCATRHGLRPRLTWCWNDAIVPKAPSIVACMREGHAYATPPEVVAQGWATVTRFQEQP